MAPQPATVVRFGVYEVNLQSGELRKLGMKVRVQNQPLKLLQILLERPGEVVSREELRERIWPEESFGDFDQAVNVAVAKLRTALGDSADNPRFVETLPRRGYRFLAPVLAAEQQVLARPSIPNEDGRRRDKFFDVNSTWAFKILLPALVVAGALLSAYHLRRGRSVVPQERTRTMLAVLPFEDLSRDSGQEYFAEGLTEELIAEMGQLNPDQLGVIASVSAMRYKSSDKTVEQIARELHADYVIEGSVRRAGNRVRVSAELIRGKDQTQLWSESYEDQVRDISALQKELSRDVAGQIRVKLVSRETRRLPVVDPEAHEDYLKGRFFFNKRNSNELALKYFQDAIRKESNYALPYTGLADIYELSDSPQLARAAVDRALQLDDQLAEAHNSLAGLLYRVDRDWARADREFNRALELDPNYAPAHHWYSMYLALMGRKKQALSEAQKAYTLDPLSPVVGANLAKILQENGQNDAAIAQARKTLELDPDSAVTHAVIGIVFEQKRLYKDAIREYRKSLDLGGPPGEIRGLLGYTYAVSGDRADAERTIEELKLLWPVHTHAALDLAVVFSGLGDKENAFAWLERADEAHVNDLIEIGRDPHFANLHGDTRFQGLLQHVSPNEYHQNP